MAKAGCPADSNDQKNEWKIGAGFQDGKERAEKLLEMAINKLGLSTYAYSRILKGGCTMADLEGFEEIQSAHISEAIQCRSLDRKGF